MLRSLCVICTGLSVLTGDALAEPAAPTVVAEAQTTGSKDFREE